MKKVVGLVCLLLCITQHDLSAVVVEDDINCRMDGDFSENDVLIYSRIRKFKNT